MPVDSSIRAGGKLYHPLVKKSERVITRMTAKWGVVCDVYYCQNDLSTLDIHSINTNELKYDQFPDLFEIKLCLPAFWENLGAQDFNFDSHDTEETGDSIFTLPDVVLPLLAKVVVKEQGTNRVYIIRKTVLEHINNEIQLFLQYFIDVMPSTDTDMQIEGLKDMYFDKSIFNPEDETQYIESGYSISKL